VVAGLLLALHLGLVPALLAGLLVHEIVHAVAPRIAFGQMGDTRARAVTVGLIGSLVIGGLVAAGFLVIAFARSEGASPAALLQKMADIIEGARGSLPGWISENLPEDSDALRVALVTWMREHARELQGMGKALGIALVHILIGMVIGAMVCFREAKGRASKSRFLEEVSRSLALLAHSFRSVVFAQVKISAVNTFFTALYLAVALPLAGVDLPLVKTMIAVTFFAGLLPVIGNLISNTVIVIVSLSHSFHAAVVSLLFLVVIHKLEYFLNARIVGQEIKASAWELLIAMLAFEAAFGLPGLVAAPILYAYVKAEMKEVGLL
jgi:predicted PurR-regulated permease PerM